MTTLDWFWNATTEGLKGLFIVYREENKNKVSEKLSLRKRETGAYLLNFAAPEKLDNLGLEWGIEADVEAGVDKAVEEAKVETPGADPSLPPDAQVDADRPPAEEEGGG